MYQKYIPAIRTVTCNKFHIMLSKNYTGQTYAKIYQTILRDKRISEISTMPGIVEYYQATINNTCFYD